MVQKNEKKLILEVLEGRLSSYEPLVKKYQSMIWAHTYRILRNSEDAQDATQETFVRAFENLRKFDPERPLKPWLYKIATNYCYDFIRKNSRVRHLNREVEAPQTPLLKRIIESEEKREVDHALRGLAAKYRQPLKEYYFNRLSYKAIAGKLGLSVNTIRTRLRRGKKLLKTALK